MDKILKEVFGNFLNKNGQVLTKNRNTKSLMAFGAMGAHINMALQALKATDFDKGE